MEQTPLQEQVTTTPSQTSNRPIQFITRRKIIGLLSAILVVSYLLPWAQRGWDIVTSLSLQNALNSPVPLLPFGCAILLFFLNLAGFRTTFVRRLAGALPITIAAIGMSKFEIYNLHTITYGTWMAIGSGLALIIMPDPPPLELKSPLIPVEKGNVLSHWYTLVPNFKTPTAEFYAAIEAELKAGEVPGLEISKVEFAEGGVLSAKRTYLRMTRERLMFDVCSAPFGTSHFFSCRFAELPPTVRLWQLALAFFGVLAVFNAFWRALGFFLGSVVMVIGSLFCIYLLRNAVAMGLRDVDATLIRAPVVGALYARFFRKETYYREDTRLMYHDTVNEIVKAKVEEVTGAKGIKLVQFNEYDPVWTDLYRPRIVNLGDAGTDTAQAA